MLTNADARRGLRALVYAIAEFALLALLWKLSGQITGEDGLREIARGALLIAGLGELGYIAENGIRAITLKGPAGIDVGVTTGATAENDQPGPQ